MPFVFFIFAAVGAMLWGAAQKQRTSDAWTEAGRRLGMTIRPGTVIGWPQLSGRFGDVGVTVEVTSSGGKNEQRWTRYTVRHPAAGPAVTLTRQAPMSGLFSFVTGRRDVTVGDPLFDERVIVDSDDEVAVRRFLSPARRAAVQDLLSVFDHATITERSIQVSKRGVSADATELVGTVTRLVDVAAVLGDVRFNEILGQRQAGHLRRAADELHDYNRGRDNRFTATVEAETLAEAGQHTQARAAFDELWADQPDDPVSSGWYDVAASPDPPPLTNAATIGSSQQAVIDDVFDVNRMSWEAVDHFEAAYRNRVVEWSGEVVSATAYDRDDDFDGGPGTRVVVGVGRAGRAGVVSNEVTAVVELAPDTHLVDGGEIRFRGVLANVDRFARTILVRHAELV